MFVPVSIMTSRSTPMPSPPVGGIEYSKEVRKASSTLGVAVGREQRLLGEPLALVDRVDQLGVGGADLVAERDEVPPLGQPRLWRCTRVSGEVSTGKSM
jgi:hypothetical protein